ncbi:lytic transglycosylase [Terrabacter sp. C0L_2]|uniref:lytic transglycosylase n=1 Tax=Terrabacter sp. C0L_2 TaxID=3108389 RepID=UPI002ED5AB03|nr:LysM peptidoglycan-binding domain-containing protein [Terrabacter sp. C0L_2]
MPFADVAALALPAHAAVAPVATTPWKTVTVRPGDTLWHLAIAHRTTVHAIVEKNRLTRGGALIMPGQKLLVPGRASGPTKAPKPGPVTPTRPTSSAPKPSAGDTTYVVRSGDTMSDIAQRYGVSLTKLLAANRMSSTTIIFVGQKITVPGTGSAASPSTPSPAPTPPPGYQYPSKTAQAVAESKAKLAAMTVPTRAQTQAMISATATRHGVDPKLALAIGWLESGWYQRAVSYTNAVGVMQLMPVSQTWASQLAGRSLDRFDTQDNITGGVLIIRALQASADSREQAIAGYYQGLYSVRTKGMYEDTKRYVASVLAVYNRL